MKLKEEILVSGSCRNTGLIQEKRKLKTFNTLIMAFFIFLPGCSARNACEVYKKKACENANSRICHEAMQKYPEMSQFECEEKIKTLGSGVLKNAEKL